MQSSLESLSRSIAALARGVSAGAAGIAILLAVLLSATPAAARAAVHGGGPGGTGLPWANIDVSAVVGTATLNGVRIDTSREDLNGRTFGLTSTRFSYLPWDSTRLTAPETYVTPGIQLCRFVQWWVDGSYKPLGQRWVDIDVTWSDIRAYAMYRYEPWVHLSVSCDGPYLANFRTSVPDVYGRSVGRSFDFPPGTTVVITAPAYEDYSGATRVFKYWSDPRLSHGELTLILQLSQHRSVTAKTALAFEAFGAECSGGAQPPRFRSYGSYGRARAGAYYSTDVEYIQPNGAFFLATGWSRTSYQGLPLPLNLSMFGWAGCWSYTSADSIELFFADAGGAARIARGAPMEFAGRTIYEQVFAANPNSSLGVSISKARATTFSVY